MASRLPTLRFVALAAPSLAPALACGTSLPARPASMLPDSPPPALVPASGPVLLGNKDADPLGLRGEIFDLPPDTSKLPDFSTLKPVGAIYTPVLNVPPRDFKEGFPGVTDRVEWFALDYKGTFLVPAAAKYSFRITSDDGTKLFVDGHPVIDNDGIHPARVGDGAVDLEPGAHAIELQYFQGPRWGIALVLEVSTGSPTMQVFDAHAASPMQAACGDGKMRLTLDGGVVFDFDRDAIKPGADAVLAQIKTAVLDAHPRAHVVVEGHTDDTGTDEHDDDLSTRRAGAVASWLVGHGVDAGRLESHGYGKHWPRFPNTSEESRAKNRRVEIVVVGDPSAASSPACPRAPAPVATGAPSASGPGDPDWAACGVVGTPCPKDKEGVTCGAKAAQGAKGFSNIVTCTGGVWQGIEVPPPFTRPPPPPPPPSR